MVQVELLELIYKRRKGLFKVVTILLIAAILFITLNYLTQQIKKLKTKLVEQKEYYESRALADSIAIVRVEREKVSITMAYKDTMLQQKITYIKLQNEYNRKNKLNHINNVRNMSELQLDSLWTNSWAAKDSLPFR